MRWPCAPDRVKTDGAEGIQKKINDMTLELARIMAKTGSADVSHIDPSVLVRRDMIKLAFS
jgi:isopentenyl diphosphate isomerase/L-lactate dehydrogenase-like FMN-dependent dehydrogenase